MRRTASLSLVAALVVAPVVASGQQPFQPPPDAFQTPSGNIHCLFSAGTLRCDVLEHDHATPPPARGCSDPWPGHLALNAEGQVTLPCRATSVHNDEAFVLGYGARWLGQGITCDSEEAGLWCTNGAGHGFQASRTQLRLF
ncbi:DUF6636 domain-containing protein [Falsiroseomonas sp. HW251]|uniref:DUF6636 domain-containing protein n=1 Tax=Falsiroseomonas sp. HW251 TaxID=3390998 RepID=UPI003D31E771